MVQFPNLQIRDQNNSYSIILRLKLVHLKHLEQCPTYIGYSINISINILNEDSIGKIILKVLNKNKRKKAFE